MTNGPFEVLKPPNFEICILAGGLSSRMGRDKARVRLGRSTMLGLVRKTARSTGLRVRTIRRDLVLRSGPLGGVYSALKTTTAQAVIFLACDMPFVKTEMIVRLVRVGKMSPGQTVFFKSGKNLTFPFLIWTQHAGEVSSCLESGKLSIQSLGKHLPSKLVRCPAKWLQFLDNINTPEELERAQKRLPKNGPAK